MSEWTAERHARLKRLARGLDGWEDDESDFWERITALGDAMPDMLAEVERLQARLAAAERVVAEGWDVVNGFSGSDHGWATMELESALEEYDALKKGGN